MTQPTRRKFGLYGGSFNPIHHGHRLVAEAAAERLGVERMLFVPAAQPPHKSADVAPAEDRLEMVRLAIGGRPGFEASDIEIRRPGKSYTIHTLEALHEIHLDADFYFLIGADTLAELETWYRIEELADLCTFVTVGRPGWGSVPFDRLRARLSMEQVERIRGHMLTDTPLIEIAARNIRKRITAGQCIRWHVPEAVADYIEARRLYK